jgi:hypothetical protein
MAIKKLSEDVSSGVRTIEINNGDLQALQRITTEGNFKDVESVLRFAIAVLSVTKDKKLFYENDQGEKVTVEPADSLRRDRTDDQEAQ